jgi:cytochrome d ubiquinol oxidase subunit I
VANSWQQTPHPLSYTLNNGRAELASFYYAVFNDSTLIRYAHTVLAAIVSGAFFMAGISAYLLRRNSQDMQARKSLATAIVVGLIASILVAFPSGHEHARQVARTQPEKFAAIEGLYSSQSGAPLVLFAYPVTPPPELKAKIEIRGMLSWLAFGDINARVKGLDEFPKDDVPPLWLTFVSFHNMVVLGMFFMASMAYGAWLLLRGRLWVSRRYLKLLMIAIPLPLLACQLGWMAAEVGRQPWIVYRLLRTADAVSVTVSAGEILFSIILFAVIYVLLGSLYVYLLVKKTKHQADDAAGASRSQEAMA